MKERERVLALIQNVVMLVCTRAERRSGVRLLFAVQSDGFRGTAFTVPNVLILFVQQIFTQLRQ
jgi:hypothetical protein